MSNVIPSDSHATGDSGHTADHNNIADMLTGTTWMPSDNGVLGANFPLPCVVSTVTALTAGTLYLAKLQVRQSLTITNINLIVNSAGSGGSTGSFAGLYSSAGTRLTGSSDVASGFTGFGYTYALTTPQALTAGVFVWAAVLCNLASTQVSLAQGYAANGGNLPNKGLSAAQASFAANGTSLTSLPASVTPASNNQSNGIPFWCGYS